MNIKINGKTIPMSKIVCLLAYKCFAQYLPISYRRGGGVKEN